MKILFRPLILTGLLSGAATLPARSQGTIVPLQKRETQELPLQNVAPHIMAWWLDPAHQPLPIELGGPEAPKALPKEQPKAPTLFTLPTGIESIVPVDAKKVLLVTGTHKAVEEVRRILRFIDQPIRQVEIETHVVPLTQEEIKFLGLDFTAPPTNGPAQPPISSTDNLANVLATHVKTGPTAEVQIPRVLALNNVTASLPVFRSYPVPADFKIASLFPQDPNKPPLELQTPLQIKLTPTINNDDTMNLSMDLTGQVQVGRQGDTTPLVLGESASIRSVLNIKDGETVAIRGFTPKFTAEFVSKSFPTKIPLLGDIPFMSALFRSGPVSCPELIVFLTPRIVRRAQP